MNAMTLPTIAVLNGLSVDTLRKRVRRDPELSRLGTWFGGTKLFSDEEVRRILAVVKPGVEMAGVK